MEKTIVLALATGQKRFSASVCKLVEKYAEILASQGLLTTAFEYLKLLGTEELPTELMILKDRITLSTQPGKLFAWAFSFFKMMIRKLPLNCSYCLINIAINIITI